MTTFGDQLYQHGGAPVGLPYSFLKGPLGKVLFVAPYRSSGTAYHGASDDNPGTLEKPMKTIAAAYALCTSNLGNIIYIIGTSNTAADCTDDWSATMTWSKSATHLIGLSPGNVAQRCRIGQLSTATGVSPLLDVTGHNNVFSGFHIFQGVDDATSLINVRVTGQRNVFDRVHFGGVGHATMSAAGAADVAIIAGAENLFKDCLFGLDTITRDADATNLLFDTAATRNTFVDCHFQAYISAAGYSHVTVADGTAIDRWQRFKNCLFSTDSENQAVTQTAVLNIPAGVQGKILLENSYYVTDGATGSGDWGTDRGLVWANMPAAAAAAAGGEMTKQ